MDKNEILKIINNYNIKKAYILAIFDNKVCLGKLENNELCFYEDVNYNFCSQIRIFNEQMELRIYKIDNQIYSKIIKDDEVKLDDDDDKYIDEYMFIVGNKITQQNEKFTVVEQQRKKIALPLPILTEDNVKKGVRLVVRNYYKVDSNSQVIISESRLLGFSLDGKELIRE